MRERTIEISGEFDYYWKGVELKDYSIYAIEEDWKRHILEEIEDVKVELGEQWRDDTVTKILQLKEKDATYYEIINQCTEVYDARWEIEDKKRAKLETQRKKRMSKYTARFPFVHENLFIEASIDPKTHEQVLGLGKIDSITQKEEYYAQMNCVHTILTTLTIDEYNNIAGDSDLKEDFLKRSVHLRESEPIIVQNEGEFFLNADEQFFAFKSWVQGIAEAGVNAIQIQESLEGAARYQAPVSYTLFKFLVSEDIDFIWQYLDKIVRECRFEGTMHKPSLWANLNFLTEIIDEQQLLMVYNDRIDKDSLNWVFNNNEMDEKIIKEFARSVIEIDIEYVFDFLHRGPWEGGGKLVQNLVNLIAEHDELMNRPDFRDLFKNIEFDPRIKNSSNKKKVENRMRLLAKRAIALNPSTPKIPEFRDLFFDCDPITRKLAAENENALGLADNPNKKKKRTTVYFDDENTPELVDNQKNDDDDIPLGLDSSIPGTTTPIIQKSSAENKNVGNFHKFTDIEKALMNLDAVKIEFTYKDIPKSKDAKRFQCRYCNTESFLHEFTEVEDSLRKFDRETFESILKCLPKPRNPIHYRFTHFSNHPDGDPFTSNVCKICYAKALREFRSKQKEGKDHINTDESTQLNQSTKQISNKIDERYGLLLSKPDDESEIASAKKYISDFYAEQNAKKLQCFYCGREQELNEFIEIEESIKKLDLDTIELIFDCFPNSTNPLNPPFTHDTGALNVCKDCYRKALFRAKQKDSSIQ